MAYSPLPADRDRLSVIPYDNHRDVVLRSAGAVVYLDPRTKQLVPSHQSVESRPHTQSDCPTCGRPWLAERSNPLPDHNPAESARDDQPNYITPDYFQMLARSLPGSASTSPPPSPRRRIAQPVRPRLETPLSTATPPPEAEFVGSVPAPASRGHGISESAFAPQYFEKFFRVEKELGRGGKGVVLLVQHVLDNVSLGLFACKRVPIGDDHGWLEKVLIEVQLLQTLSHQNLVSYRHVWLEDFQLNTFGPSVPCAFILQQYCNGGDLHNYICGSAQLYTTTTELKERIRRRSRGEKDMPQTLNEPKKLSFDEIYAFFRDITAGLLFLHQNGFIHRDLKPSNCLLHVTGQETRVLVSDFGEVQYEADVRKSTGATGTISYCAPEVLRRVTMNGPLGNFTSKSDIFSLGMILHFLCFANLPYRAADVLHEEKEDVDELRAEILEWEGFDDHRKLRPDLPGRLYTFLKRLLAVDPEHRPSAEEVNLGIKTGGLDEAPRILRRNSTSPEDLTPGPRIQNFDGRISVSPQRSTDTNIDLKGKKSRFSERARSRTGYDRGISSAIEESPEGLHETANLKDSQTIVLRPRIPSATTAPSSPINPLSSPSSPQAIPLNPLLLLEPPQTRLQRIHRSITSILITPLPSTTFRIILLLSKLISVLQPCITTSKSMNASVLYPLMTLALVEFVTSPRKVWEVGLATGMHMCVLIIALESGGLCHSSLPREGMMRWDDR